MFSLFAARRRASRPSWFGVSRNPAEMLEDRVLLSGTSDPQYELEVDPVASALAIEANSGIAIGSQSAIGAWSFDTSDAFKLHSKPDSNWRIYLDFDGQVVTGTQWNINENMPVITNVGYDFDGDSTTFSTAERDAITRAWQIVAEDFAAFDVDVTTEEPPIEDLMKSGGGDTRWGVRVIMTDAFGSSVGTGGVAFLTSFNSSIDTPCYVYNGVRGGSNGAIRVMAETISHEVGHTLGLSHDGLVTGNVTYYGGHGAGPESWGAIMGAAFSPTTTHWSNGDYFDANNQQDDLSIITSQNGFGYRQDDYGNTRASATPISPTNGTNIDITGIVEQTSDIDYIKFDAGNGPASFTITNYSERPNLNVFAALYDASGTLITMALPKDDPGATLSAVLTTGTYYLRIEGMGSDGVYNGVTDAVTDPANGPWTVANPTGFSEYSSIGLYAVTGTVVSARADYGDAPDSYGTLDASDGPRHLITGPILGAQRDGETDGSPGVDANGDGGDEDGVTFTQTLIPGRTSNITLTSITGGFVDAWIDFDANGTFDAGEQIATNLSIPIGTTTLPVLVPANVQVGNTYARFRIAAAVDDVTGPTGQASNGEVEDYKVTVKPAQAINEVLFNTSGDNTGNEYIELRSSPGTVIENGTYLVVVEGDGNGGTIDMVYNLSGLQYGSNGYLVLLQKDNPYFPDVDPASTIVQSSQIGWRDNGTRVSILGFSENNLENGSQTYFLMKSAVRPNLGSDIDVNNDGTPDSGGFSGWDILDSVGYIDANTGDQAYGAINFRTGGAGLVPVGSVSVDIGAGPLSYVGRNLISQGPAASGWVAGDLQNGTGPLWTLTAATPVGFNGRPLDHIGSLNFDQADFGDLPDVYLTTKGVGGASHGVGGPILGTSKDVETNGKPSVAANLDDNSSSDDEDGVTIPAAKEGTTITVSILVGNVTGSAIVQGWFDWNGDGDFADAGENAITGTVGSNGVVNFNVAVPQGAFDDTDGVSYARFRISSTGVAGPAGAAADGEVEDYQITILTSATDDFGDAPDSYGTTLANNGARHTGVGPTLGPARDIERDGRVSANAQGDDTFKLDDEDGVLILTPVAPGNISTASVNAPTGGVMDAWLDLNRNGRFDSDEQVITDVVLTPGDNLVNFTVPGGATVGSSFMRYRIAAAAGDVTAPAGPATNGEVEDYQVEILPIFNRPPRITGGTFTIAENSPNGTPVGSVSGSDPDLGQTVSFAITKGNFGGAFAVNPVTGAITVASSDWVDYEIQNVFDLEITATDTGNPALSAKTTVRVNLTDVADIPSLLVREGDAAGTRFGLIPTTLSNRPLTFNIVNGNTVDIGGTPVEAFRIDGDGIIAVNDSRPLDFETHPVFNLEVFVTDALSNTEQVFVTVKVLDRNEAPITSDYTFSVFENAANGSKLGQVVATDPDIGQTVRFAIYSGNESGAFAIDAQGNITVRDTSKIKFDQQSIHDLVISVSDTADIPYTVPSKVRIFVRKFAYSNVFSKPTLGSEWTTNGSAVGVVGNKLSLQQSGATAQTLIATLSVDLLNYDDITLAFKRTIVGADTTGRVQISDDGGVNWITLQSFSGAVDPVGTEQRFTINLSAAAQLAGRSLRGITMVRFVAQTTNQTSGVCIDDVLISGRQRIFTPDDVLIYDQTTNSFKIGFSDGQKFNFVSTPWLPGSNWEFVYGDFNNDQRLDVAGFDTVAKRWVVGVSTGTSLNVKQWTKLNATSTWSNFVVGDFNDDGFDDVAAQTETGQVWIGYSNGTRFINRPGVLWDASGWAKVLAGDVNGDGRDDLVGLRIDGTLAVGIAKPGMDGLDLIANAGTFGFANWEDVLLGDFNGDGKMEIVGRKRVAANASFLEKRTDGQIWIGNFQAGHFVFSYATKWNNDEVWSSVLVADVNNDGRDDLVGRTAAGAHWAAVSNGSGLVNQYLGKSTANPANASLAARVQTVAGDFNHDGIVDFATFFPNPNEWNVGLGGGTRLNFQSFGQFYPGSVFRKPGAGPVD